MKENSILSLFDAPVCFNCAADLDEGGRSRNVLSLSLTMWDKVLSPFSKGIFDLMKYL